LADGSIVLGGCVTDVPDYGLLNDLVWSDPSDTALEWEDNERGVSYCYGKAVINSFLATHVSRSADPDQARGSVVSRDPPWKADGSAWS